MADDVSPSARVKAMEVAVVFSTDDFAQYCERVGTVADGDLAQGFAYSGSYAGRNIEAIYEKAEVAGIGLSLEKAVTACFGSHGVRHVLICGGFYVLHNKGLAPPAGLAPGSCETDGPLGVLALVRAFAARGVYASLLCDVHNGPVIKAGYDAMMEFFSEDQQVAAYLRRYSRCLPFVSDTAPADEGEEDRLAFSRLHSGVFPGEQPDAASLRCRALRLSLHVASAMKAAWGDTLPGEVDCLFALERLGAPYRNIRGKYIGEHTEPIDCLWPLLDVAEQKGSGVALCEKSAESVAAFADAEKLGGSTVASLRRIAGVAQDALTLAVGDGGNEVGLGKVAHLDVVAPLKPSGADFVALSVNGCYRTCDHLLLATVSNWGGTAFEMAAHVLFPAAIDYVGMLKSRGHTLADLEERLLVAAVAAYAVDGISAEVKQQVDGMPYDPQHRQLYHLLWKLSGAGGPSAV